MNTTKGTLYLIPSLMGICDPQSCIPPHNIEIVNSLSVFIVEEESSAYRTLRRIGFNQDFKNISLFQLNEHSRLEDVDNYLDCTKLGTNIGLLSEAGLPCLADPGAMIVKLAHERNIKVVPLSGPTSIASALIASGMNGQCFAFNGYPPVKSPFKENKIKFWEKISAEYHQTQIFIEAPYRNIQLFNTLLNTCAPSTLLSIASNVHCDDELIAMKTIAQWKISKIPDIHKKPTVFCLLAQ